MSMKSKLAIYTGYAGVMYLKSLVFGKERKT